MCRKSLFNFQNLLEDLQLNQKYHFRKRFTSALTFQFPPSELRTRDTALRGWNMQLIRSSWEGSMAHKFKWPLAVVSALSMQRSTQEPVSLRRRWVHLQCLGRAWPGDLLPCTAAIDYGLDVRRDSRIDGRSGETCLSLCEATGLLGEAFESFIDIFLPCGAG